jgi:hypothetical protein
MPKRIWQAYLKHYAGDTNLAPTYEQIVKLMLKRDHDKSASVSTVARAFKRADYARFLPKKIVKGQLPPWIEHPEDFLDFEHDPVPLHADDDRVVYMDIFDDQGHRSVAAVKVDRHGIPHFINHMVAVGIASLVVLDLLDDHLDRLIHWCRLVAEVAARN